LLARPEPFDHILVETSGLADPTPVAATFFMDNDVARQLRLDGVVTLIDALHIEGHLDDPLLREHDNQAVDQILAADRIVLNKTDLVDEATLVRVEQRIRKINEGAPVLRSNHAQVDLTRILSVGGFAPAAALVDDEAFLGGYLGDHAHVCDEACDHEPGHAHDPSVGSVSMTLDDAFDAARLDAYLNALVAECGDDIFRLKGILAIAGDDRRHVLQGVHRILDRRPAGGWGTSTPSSKLVFIGRNLNAATLRAGLALATVG